MALPEDAQTRISALQKRLKKCVSKLNRLKDDDYEDERYAIRDKAFISIFTDACALVREAEAANAPHLSELLPEMQKLLDEAIRAAYNGDDQLYGFMPSWAHDDEGGQPLVKDRGKAVVGLAFNAIASFMEFMGLHDNPGLRPTINPWTPLLKRHAKTSSLARFRPELQDLTPAWTDSQARMVYDARCEVSSSSISSPMNITLSEECTVLALSGMGGFKNRSPALDCFLLDKPDDEYTKFYENKFTTTGLAHIAPQMMTDETRRLIFVGDKFRVKSYSWATADGTYRDKVFPTHTLDSEGGNGPMLFLPNGSLVRAGTGGARVWKVDDIQNHGPKGRKIIGQKMDAYDLDTWRDDSEDIELSTGVLPTSYIDFVDQPTLIPTVWQNLIGVPSTVLCAENGSDGVSRYGCCAIDLEHGGKTKDPYIGHGRSITDFSVSAGDPRVFLTACNDGFARLYDLRQSLPALTLDACGEASFCTAVALAHPDGIPTAFTGSYEQEQIKMWDIRPRAAVYELATGNNAVMSLAWDAKHLCLFATIECTYKNRIGFHHDYRQASIPSSNPPRRSNLPCCWPEQAWHCEDYFEYAFGAGDHSVYRYAFKADPDLAKVPEYGSAQENEMKDFW